MHKKFEVNQTKIKGGCQSGMISNSEMFLKQMNILLELTNVSLFPQVIRKFSSSAALLQAKIRKTLSNKGKNMMQ